MFDYNYFYLTWALIFLGIWAFLFWRRKDVRREMLLVSIVFGFGGLVSEKTNIQDWWQPLTITGTSIGPEDFIIGFAIGGVAAVIYEEIYKKRLKKAKIKTSSLFDPGFFFLLSPSLYLAFFFLFSLGSFYSMLLTFLICIVWMLFLRRDLLADSLLSGFLMLVIGIGIYFFLFLLYPNYIHEFWYLKPHRYASLLWGIPIAEYIWYFLAGAYIGPLYAFLKRLRVGK